jgi:hypothetical protein
MNLRRYIGCISFNFLWFIRIGVLVRSNKYVAPQAGSLMFAVSIDILMASKRTFNVIKLFSGFMCHKNKMNVLK